MSNDIIRSIQSALAKLPAGMGLDEDTRAVAGTGGKASGAKRISIKGGVFRKIVGGKEMAAIEDRFMNVVLVRMSHDAARTYYSQGYQEGTKTAPVCWSSNSKAPDESVPNPQAKRCDQCPQSIKGSAQGGMGSACRLQWRTAVVLPDDVGGDVMQLVLPATSAFGKEESGKWPFVPYVQMLANNNVSASAVITRMQFDTKSPVPKLLFSPVGMIEPDDAEVLLRQAKSAAADEAIKLTVFQTDEGIAPEAVVAAPVKEKKKAKVEVEVEEVEVAEPTLREAKKPDASPTPDARSVIDKWKKN